MLSRRGWSLTREALLEDDEPIALGQAQRSPSRKISVFGGSAQLPHEQLDPSFEYPVIMGLADALMAVEDAAQQAAFGDRAADQGVDAAGHAESERVDHVEILARRPYACADDP